jgi:hypothetical protein
MDFRLPQSHFPLLYDDDTQKIGATTMVVLRPRRFGGCCTTSDSLYIWDMDTALGVFHVSTWFGYFSGGALDGASS